MAEKYEIPKKSPMKKLELEIKRLHNTNAYKLVDAIEGMTRTYLIGLCVQYKKRWGKQLYFVDYDAWYKLFSTYPKKLWFVGKNFETIEEGLAFLDTYVLEKDLKDQGIKYDKSLVFNLFEKRWYPKKHL